MPWASQREPKLPAQTEALATPRGVRSTGSLHHFRRLTSSDVLAADLRSAAGLATSAASQPLRVLIGRDQPRQRRRR